MSLLILANGIRQDAARAPLTSYGLLVGIAVFLIVPFFTVWGSGGRIVESPGPAPGGIVGLTRSGSVLPANPPPARKPGIDDRIIEYLKWEIDPSNNDILLATQRARDAAPFILEDINTIAIGGFSGGDPIFNVDEFVEFAEGENLGFFLIGNTGPDRFHNLSQPLRTGRSGQRNIGQPPPCKPSNPPPWHEFVSF